MSRLREKYAAFRSRNFTFLFLGQSISFIGTWMQIVAQGWLVDRLTGSSVAVGLVAFLAVIPSVFLTPLAGTLADRISAKSLLLLTGTCGALQASIFYWCYAHGMLSVAGIYVLSFAWGIISAIDGPVRYTCYAKVVESKAIPSAMAMNGMLVALGFILGPAIGGYVIAKYGVERVFAVNAASFVPVIVSVLLIDSLRPPATGKPMHSFFRDAQEGILYSMDTPIIGPMLRFMGMAMFFGFSYRAIIPLLADALQLNTKQFGWLSAAPGIGAIIAAFTIQFFFDLKRLKGFLAIGTIALGCALIGAACTRSFTLSMAFFIAAGFGLDLIVITTQSVSGAVARKHGERFLGRVMGCGSAMFFCGNAFGSLLLGLVARWYGAFPMVGCCGVALLLAAYFFKEVDKLTTVAVEG